MTNLKPLFISKNIVATKHKAFLLYIKLPTSNEVGLRDHSKAVTHIFLL